MDPSQRAAEILALAAQTVTTGAWFARLADDDRKMLDELRSDWQANRSAYGVSAAQVARTIIAQLPGRKLPVTKELAAWLNREPPRS